MAAVDLDQVDSFASVDPEDMLGLVEGFEEQCRTAVEIGRSAPLPPGKEFSGIVIAGMGGSAIGGDLLATSLAPDLRQPWVTNRDYSLPAWVGPGTLLIAGSYSGNTEETISALTEGIQRGAAPLCLTSGGTIASIAREQDLPLIEIPGGLPPRAALGLSFFPLAVVLGRMGLAPVSDADLDEALEVIGRSKARYGRTRPSSDNPAKTLAQDLRDFLPIVYTGPGLLSSVAVRWKGQFNENSKKLSYYNVFPELNHNEIEGWEGIGEIGRQVHLVFLRDHGDSPRVQRRMEITAEIVGSRAGRITELHTEGRGRMARVFSLVCLGDFVSVYLALISGQDPTPVDNIGRLKEALASLPG